MLFHIIKFLVHRVFYLFFERIYSNGLDNIPKDKPVIVAATHTYGLLDPLLVLSVTPRPLYSITRGDIFNSTFKKWLLGQLYMVSIFRVQDGGDTIQKNKKTFEQVNKVLGQNDGILIFPEGGCVMSKQVQPLKKGAARMAFNLMEQEGLDVYVVPTGVNYSHYERPRIDALVSFGKPIQVSDFWAIYQENPAKGLRQFNKALQQGIEEQMITIEEEELEIITEQFLILKRTDLQLPKWQLHQKDNNKRLLIEQNTTKQVQNMAVQMSEQFKNFSNYLTTYFSLLEAHKIKDNALFDQFKNWEKIIISLGSILMLPLFILSKGLSIRQFFEQTVRKTLQKTDDFFYGSFYTVYILVALLGFFILNWIGFGVLFKNGLLGFLTALGSVVWIYYYVKFESLWKRWKAVRHVQRLKKKNPILIKTILEKRKEILKIQAQVSSSKIN